MKQSKSISGINHHYPMGMHIAMQDQLYGLIQPIAPEKIALEPTDIPSWKADIEQERELVRETTAAEESASIIEKDKKRDEVITSIFQEVRLADKSLIEARQTAGHRLRLVVDTYKGLQTENKIEETGHITGLLNDLDKPSAVADLATLGLTPLVQKLRTYNNEFIALQDSRLKAGASINLPPTAKMRAKNDATATEIFRHIEAAYITTATDEDRKTIGELIDRINKVLQAVKTTYRQSLAQKRATAEKKPKDPKKPKEPKDPKQPKDPKKPGGGDDIQIPSEPPKKPGDAEQPTPNPGGGSGGGDDIHLPEEPPQKPDGQ